MYRAVIKKIPVVFFTFSDPAKNHLFIAFFYDFAEKNLWTPFLRKRNASHRFFYDFAVNEFWAPFFGAKRRKTKFDPLSSALSAEKTFWASFLVFYGFIFSYGFGQLLFLALSFFMVLVRKLFYSPECSAAWCR